MKLKTNKSFAKRIKVTARKKLLHRAKGQDHFNAKQPGKTTRRLHKIISIAKVDQKNIKRYLPYK